MKKVKNTLSEMLSFLHRLDCFWRSEFDTNVKIEINYHHDWEQLHFYKKSTYQRYAGTVGPKIWDLGPGALGSYPRPGTP